MNIQAQKTIHEYISLAFEQLISLEVEDDFWGAAFHFDDVINDKNYNHQVATLQSATPKCWFEYAAN